MENNKDLEDFLSEVGQAVALGMVPFLGQAIDIYDTLYAAYDIYCAQNATQEEKEEAYFNMVMAAVGWIPGPGDGIKKTLKTINKHPEKYAPLLLDAVRGALYQAGYRVDPYHFLMDSLNENRIRHMISGATESLLRSGVYQRSPHAVQHMMREGISLTLGSLPLMVGLVERKVKKWLHMAPKSTSLPARHAPEAQHPPAKQQGSRADVGSEGKANARKVLNGTMNATEIATANLNQKQESIGEHVADYYCHDTLGWGKRTGSTARHDQGEASPAKLTDGQKLSTLSTEIKVRGVGIDAIWKSAGLKPYAVTEYKTRKIALPEAAMKRLLVAESAQDAGQKPPHRQKQSAYRKANKQTAKTGVPHGMEKPELAKSVPKMSHKWIKDRVERRTDLGVHKSDLLYRDSYTRHVIQVVTSTGDGKTHQEELNAAIEAKRQTVEAKHTGHASGVHNFTNVFTEAPGEKTETSAQKPPTKVARPARRQ